MAQGAPKAASLKIFPPVLLYIFINRQSQIFSNMFALRILTVLLGLEPPTMRFLFERSVRVERVRRNSPKLQLDFFLCPSKKPWKRRCARPQAPKRWPGRLFAIKLRINDGFGMFFRCILTTRLTLCFGLSRFLFGAPMGATRYEHQSFHSRMHVKDGATGQFTSFAQKNFSTPTATSSNVVGEL